MIIQKKNLTETGTKKSFGKEEHNVYNEQPVTQCQTGAAVQIVIPTDNELDDRTSILKNLLFIWRYCSYDPLTNEFNGTANETNNPRYSIQLYQ